MMAGGHSGDASHGGEMDPALRDALSVLSGAGPERSPQQLVEALQARFAAAGRRKLADLVYELVKACLAAFPDFAERVELLDPPREAESISGEMLTMGRRLEDLSAGVDLGPVARSTPESEAALDAAARGLAVLAHLEGESDRQRLAAALHHVHGGTPEAAEPLLRPLLDEPGHDPDARAFAATNLALALHRAGRSAEALELAEDALDHLPTRPANTMNVLASAAAVGDTAAFDRGLARLADLWKEGATPLLRGWIAGSLPRHAARVEVPWADVLDRVGLTPADLEGEG